VLVVPNTEVDSVDCRVDWLDGGGDDDGNCVICVWVTDSLCVFTGEGICALDVIWR
jgi:hypothetical protein